MTEEELQTCGLALFKRSLTSFSSSSRYIQSQCFIFSTDIRCKYFRTGLTSSCLKVLLMVVARVLNNWPVLHIRFCYATIV